MRIAPPLLALTFLPALTFAFVGSALAQNQPIQSPQDAACRDEASRRVFDAPNPKGLGLYQLGSELYYECMRRSAPTARGRPRA